MYTDLDVRGKDGSALQPSQVDPVSVAGMARSQSPSTDILTPG